MKKFRGFLCGFLAASILLLSVPSLAETIQATFNQMILNINGQKINEKGQNYQLSSGDMVPYSIVYKGTTYLPLRKLVELLGKELTLDGATSTVYIKEKATTTPTPTPEPTPSKTYSYSNPAPIGTMQTLTKKDLLQTYSVETKVTQIIRGAEAWTMIQAANMFNDPAPDGYEYILAKIYLKVNDINDGQQYNLSDYNYTLVSSDGKDYEHARVVDPEPALSANLYKGASNEGWAVFQVKTTDTTPKIAFDRDYNGSGGLWFKAYN